MFFSYLEAYLLMIILEQKGSAKVLENTPAIRNKGFIYQYKRHRWRAGGSDLNYSDKVVFASSFYFLSSHLLSSFPFSYFFPFQSLHHSQPVRKPFTVSSSHKLGSFGLLSLWLIYLLTLFC